MATKSFIAQTGQSLSDLALMAYGDSSMEFALLKENPTLNRHAASYAGVKIVYTPPTNNANYTRLGLTKLVFATSSVKLSLGDYLLQENEADFLLEDNTGKLEVEN
ncbi:MAG TPA: hypothetical protein VK835_09980 [Bacteroidia bacterium]|jgi:hypothetical protein|nr:hypothetical protein [Bacteroidia bacterium]